MRDSTRRYMNIAFVPPETGIHRIVDAFRATNTEPDQTLPEDVAQSFAKLEEMLLAKKGELETMFADQIETSFTDEELTALADFEESPLGKRQQEVKPALMQRLMQTMDAWFKTQLADTEWTKFLGAATAATPDAPAPDPLEPTAPSAA